ncbi:PD-(D/E)XK motif protein [Kribbella sp. NPDC056345]|uniref:PD-(D/E)XK motif protein n=1 Tax=Kribbella sp. NPDC056345 TaxID=3345789 RepID=UPI0035D822B2
MDTREILQRGWAVLEPRTDGHLASFPLDVRSAETSCRLAVDRSGARHLLVPVDGEHAISAQRGSALVVEQRSLVFGESQHSYIDLTCVQPELYLEFDDVVEDVVEAVQATQDTGAATLDVVARWRRLFRADLVRGLGVEARRGLFGELSCLSCLVDVDPDFDVASWTGPLGQPHDLELSSACIEVKALGIETEDVRIHGLEQLDAHDGKPLQLVLITVVEDPQGQSIDDLVSDLGSRVNNPALFKSRLMAVGWSESDPFGGDRYAVGQVAGVRVTSSVPRLVSTSLTTSRLPEGVRSVTYSIDRQSLLPFAVNASLVDIAREVLL